MAESSICQSSISTRKKPRSVSNDYLASRTFFFGIEVHIEIADRRLSFFKFQLNVDFLAQLGEVVLVGQPLGKVVGLVRPNRPQVCDVCNLSELHCVMRLLPCKNAQNSLMQPTSYRLKQEAMELELGKNIGMLIRRVIGQSGGVSIQGRSAVCTVFF